jgi:FkbM family methyltransferase
VVADIGANIGLTAILFSTLASKVYAFEPSPSTYRILADNLARAGVDNVEAINLGLGHKEESLTITFAKNNRSGGYVSDKIRPETGHVTEEIQIDTLDHYFDNKVSPPNFLKIDVEGFEQNVIKGGGGFLEKNKPTVVMEMNHFCLDVLQRVTLPDFLDFMRSAFPYIYAVDADNSTVVDLHLPDQAYMVMHEHVVKHRFPNLVGGFDPKIKPKLDKLAHSASRLFTTPALTKPAGRIMVQTAVQTVTAGGLFEIPVSLSNESQEIWHGYGDRPVLLSYHWKKQDGSYLVYDGLRTELQNVDLAPGNTVDEKLGVVAPNEKGTYQLILTVVQEGVCWFEDKGFMCETFSVAVI